MRDRIKRRCMRKILAVSYFFLSTFLFAQQEYHPILSMKERAGKIDELLKDRFTRVLPEIMRREEIDMWIIIAREYNEDPVIKTMLVQSGSGLQIHFELVTIIRSRQHFHPDPLNSIRSTLAHSLKHLVVGF